MPGLVTTAMVLLIICTLAIVYWVIVWVRVSRMMRNRPSIRAGEALPEPEGGWPKLSIIIPAHNEEQVIATCCQSLCSQEYPPDKLEIIFVLDRCTDNTANIIKRHAADDQRIVVIENESCPDDWAGKCNAARLGADRATGDYLLFTDADTRFAPTLCRAAVALAIKRNITLLSLLSTLTFTRHFEKVVQPVATMNLMRLYPLRRRRDTATGGSFANGQFMLFPRTWYEKIGGHAAVKDVLLEDLGFARLVYRHGGTTSVLLADGMLICDMYDSLEEFRVGWKRIFIEASHRWVPNLRKYARRVITSGIVLPAAQIASVCVSILLYVDGINDLATALLVLALVGWAVQFTVLAWVYRIGMAPVSAVVYYPIGCWILAAILLEAAKDLEQRRPVRWGGREYVLEPLVLPRK